MSMPNWLIQFAAAMALLVALATAWLGWAASAAPAVTAGDDVPGRRWAWSLVPSASVLNCATRQAPWVVWVVWALPAAAVAGLAAAGAAGCAGACAAGCTAACAAGWAAGWAAGCAAG